MVEFARRLPAMRARRRASAWARRVSREHVLACAVRLLDLGFFRIGSEDYAVRNETYGLATMKKRHVRLQGDGVLSSTTRPSTASASCARSVDPTLADVVMRLKRRRRGGTDELLAYKDGGRWVDVARADINDFLKEATGRDVSAKDFRTWNATALAAVGLAVVGPRAGDEDRAAGARSTGGQGGGLLPGQHARGGARLVHRPARLRPLRGRPGHRRLARAAGGEEATAIQGPLEEAVLELLEGG